MKQHGLYFDFEANGLLREATVIHCLSTFNTMDGTVRSYHNSPEVAPMDGTLEQGITELLRADTLIGHNNIGYDNPLVKKILGIDIWKAVPHTIDDLILSKWLNPRLAPVKGFKGAHSMGAWGARLGEPKVEHDEWETFTPEMLRRNRGDVILGARIHQHLFNKLELTTSTLHDLMVEHAFAHIVSEAEEVGHPFHFEGYIKCLEFLRPEKERLSKVILENFPRKSQTLEKLKGEAFGCMKGLKKDGTPAFHCQNYMGEEVGIVWGDFCRVSFPLLNLESDKQVKEALLKLGWQPREWNRSKKTNEITSPKLTEDSYSSLPPGLGQTFATFMQVKHRLSLLEGLHPHLYSVGDEVFLRHSIDILGTAAHRVTHRVLVNVPNARSFFGAEIRSLFVPHKGDIQIGTDLEGAHLHEVGVWMGDEVFMKALLEGDKAKGEDAHSKNAAVMGVVRDDAKIIVYTYINGGRAGRVATQIGISKKQAERALKGISEGMPKLNGLIDYIISRWKKNGYVKLPSGARVYPVKSNDCLSYLLLGTEAAIMKEAIVIGWGKMFELGKRVRFLSMNHDEVQVSVSPADKDIWKDIISAAIETASRRNGVVPEMRSETSAGESWLDTH